MYREVNKLVKLSQEGNDLAKERLLLRLKPLILASIRRYYNHREEYEDLIQEGYEIVLRALKDYDPNKGSQFLGYTKLQLKYHYLDKNKGKILSSLNVPIGDEDMELLDLLESKDAGPVDKILSEEELGELVGALNLLTERQREIIMEFYFNGLSLKDIARKLNISYSTVANTKTSGLKKLRDHLVK